MGHRRTVPLIVLALAVFSGGLVSTFGIVKQEESQAQVPKGAYRADVTSIDAIIAALYDVISGPAGDRDWDRMRTLFSPGARLIPIRIREERADARVGSVDDYIENAGPYFRETNFYETEIARTTEFFNNLAHVFSTYESRRSPEEASFTRGINSIQLLKDGDRWWIVTIFWDSERFGNPIPAKYLP